MQADIEAHHFFLVLDAQRRNRADDFENDEGEPARPDQGDGNAIDLSHQLMRIALEQAVNSAGRFRADRKRADREHAGEQGSGEATDAMHAEHVE